MRTRSDSDIVQIMDKPRRRWPAPLTAAFVIAASTGAWVILMTVARFLFALAGLA